MKGSLFLIIIAGISPSDCCKNFVWNPFLPHVSALILARGGSKGIPLKNLCTVGNTTLLGIALKTIKQTEGFSSTWVSTDNSLISEEAQKYELVNIHWRENYTATDEASSLIAVQEFLKKHPVVDAICLVQCTSPFMRPEYLNEALNKFLGGHECVFSATRSFKHRWQVNGGKLNALNFEPGKRLRRQDWEGELVENGMFYLATRELILSGYFQSERCHVVEIPERDSLEIDHPWDLYVANKIADNLHR